MKMVKTSVLKPSNKDTRKWKDLSCSQTGTINIVKRLFLSRAIYRFNGFPIKIPTTFFRKIKKNYPKIYIEQKTPDSQSDPEQKEQCQNYYSKFQDILQNHGNKSSKAMPPKQTSRPMEQNRKPK